MERVEIRERTGEIVYLNTPFEDDGLELVLDSEGCLWARERGRPSTDGLFGSNARIVGA
jgi:hypothetical protein